MKDNAPQQTSTRGTTGISLLGYILGGASFIPLIGVLFGIAAIVVGATSRKKVPAILGACGIVFTLVLYGSLIYFGLYASFGPWAALRRPLAVQILDTTKGKKSSIRPTIPGSPETWKSYSATIRATRSSRSIPGLMPSATRLALTGPSIFGVAARNGTAGNDDDILPSR